MDWICECGKSFERLKDAEKHWEECRYFEQETLNRWCSAARDPINPVHYTGHPSGVECIQITEHMNFTLGNAMKYIWRAGLKGDAVGDLKKARWYLDREIARLS